MLSPFYIIKNNCRWNIHTISRESPALALPAKKADMENNLINRQKTFGGYCAIAGAI
jgi:hypothetical protein